MTSAKKGNIGVEKRGHKPWNQMGMKSISNSIFDLEYKPDQIHKSQCINVLQNTMMDMNFNYFYRYPAPPIVVTETVVSSYLLEVLYSLKMCHILWTQ